MPVAYGYCRVSTGRQDVSLRAQEQIIKARYQAELASTHAWGDCFADPDQSGRIPFNNREAGNKLNLRLEAGDVVLITKLDRGFRNTLDCFSTLHAWKERGIKAKILEVGLDTTTPIGEFIIGVLACFAQFERQCIAERLRLSHAQRRLEGKPRNGNVPYGMKRVGPRGNKRFIPDAYDIECAELIVKLRREGHGWDQIWRHFWVNKLKTKNGKEWSVCRIRRVLNWYLTRVPAIVPKAETNATEYMNEEERHETENKLAQGDNGGGPDVRPGEADRP